MVDIKIKKLNEATLQLECSSNNICGELSNYFSAFVDNYRFMPAFRISKTWDGKARAFDSRTGELPIGLMYKLLEFCKKGGYTYEKKFSVSQQIEYNDYLEFVKSLNILDSEGNPMEARDYQLKAAYDALTIRHLNISSTTSSGKSLILYIIIRWMVKENLKTLLIVPNTILVEQMFSDFYSYGWKEVEDRVCMIYSGKQRLVNRPVIISTWQSLFTEKDIPTLHTVNTLLIDEGHGLSENAKSLKMIAKNTINANTRIGLSGSFPEPDTANWLSAVGSLGQIRVYSTYKSLQEKGYISDFIIKPIILQYPMSTRLEVYNLTKDIGNDDDVKMMETKKYAIESEYVNKLPERNEFIFKLVSNLQGNILILFKNIDAHGKPLYEEMKNRFPDKKVIYLDGKTAIKDRVNVCNMMETLEDTILFASTGIFSVGVSIKNLMHLVLVSGNKSRTKLIQMIGRMLRLHKNKSCAYIMDIVDDLSFKDKINKIYFKNYAMKHYQDRLKIYTKNEFKVEPMNYKIKESK